MQNSVRWRKNWRKFGASCENVCYTGGMTYAPKYTIGNTLLSHIAEIEAFRARIDGSYILPEREIAMRYRATIEATRSSTGIEGNPLNIKQVEAVLANKQPLTRHQYAELEVRNYKKALDFIDKRKHTKQPITLDDILRIHGVIMHGLLPDSKRGQLRTRDVYVVDKDDNELYAAPDATTVLHELTNLLDWLVQTDSIHPVIASAILHFQFVTIHPFTDGNGRTTRALTWLYLGLRDYDFRDALVLDSYYFADKQAYYEALNSRGNTYEIAAQSDLTPWIQYFAEGFLSCARVLSTEITLLASAVDAPTSQSKLSRDDADLLNYAKQFGSLTLAEAEDILPSTPRRTIQRRLKRLVDEKYLEMSGRTNTTAYRLRDES